MELEVFAPSIPYLAAVLVVGLFLWWVFVRMLAGMEARFNYLDKQVGDQFRQVDTRFASLESRFDSLDKKVHGLAADHHGLARRTVQVPGRYARSSVDARSPDRRRAIVAEPHQRSPRRRPVGDGLVPSRPRS